MRTFVNVLLGMVMLVSCQTEGQGSRSKAAVQAETGIQSSEVFSTEAVTSYLLPFDRGDTIGGGQVIQIESVAPLQVKTPSGAVKAADFGYFQSFVKEVVRRGFVPDKFIYYSNNSKDTKNVVLYENGKIIFSTRIAERAATGSVQKPIPF